MGDSPSIAGSICPGCRRENPGEFAFCPQCGAALRARQAAAPDRRQLSVMFCDVVGSTRISSNLDAEDLRDVLRSYQERCDRVIAAFGGYVAQYLGDGLLVYFGYPQAHEDDAQRAVRAGLGVIHTIAEMPAIHGERLEVRIAIHTGPVVMGEVGSRDRSELLALGDTVNLAARLEGVAAPGTLVVSAATWRLVSELFRGEDLGPQTLRGIARQVWAHRVLGEVGGAHPENLSRACTPLIGRDQELAILLDCWQRVRESQPQIVQVSGEPGLGKSRLVSALLDEVVKAGGRWHLAHCAERRSNDALAPVLDLLCQELGVESEQPGDLLAALEQRLASLGLGADAVLPLLEPLLGQVGAEPVAPPANPDAVRQRALGALLEVWLGGAKAQPLVLVLEDLQWADPTTLEFLGDLSERLNGSLLLLVTHRPEFQNAWPRHPHVTPIVLAKLTRAQTVEMIRAVAGERVLAERLVERLAERTDGVPLFCEEITKAMLESEQDAGRDEPAADAAIPSTLRASLTARLDRLGEAKQLAQLASVVGREFQLELLDAVADAELDVAGALRALIEAELVCESSGGVYFFKHALIQEAAYDSLLRRRRRELHGRVAEALAERLPELAQEQPERLAHHRAESGDIAGALDGWTRAAQRVAHGGALSEALGYLEHALRRVLELPEGRDRDRREVALLLGKAPLLVTREGFVSREFRPTLLRAEALARALGDERMLLGAQLFQSVHHQAHGEYAKALEMGERVLALAEQVGSRFGRARAHVVLQAANLNLGAFAATRRHVAQALELSTGATPRDPGPHAADIVVISHCHGALAEHVLGRPDRALEACRQALAAAHALQVPHPNSVASAHLYEAWVRYQRREPRQALAAAEAGIEAVREQAEYWTALQCRLIGLCARGELAGEAEAVHELRRAIAEYEASGMRVMTTVFLGSLARGLAAQGALSDALETIDTAVRHAEELHEGYCAPDLQRTRGDVLRARDREEAERCYRRALAQAREQGARAWQLRAAVALVRLCGTGELAALRSLCGDFAEGADTPDLREARALLEAGPV